ncbi:hypothetical protein BDN70DRAFT_924153 [Pholiota conissans]|uniref:Uncharacterized protein n=1 Tax=Pholiota conissans TaxID=109636 RepID=A0A9P5YUZ1_9AGAR|nr:hypothetical protein BDN70DRAFT_924153 [Pholiota conissans]
MASAAADVGDSPKPRMTMFSNMTNLTISDGKFTQVMGDYHFHANSAEATPNSTMKVFGDTTNTQTANNTAAKPSATPSVQAGGDYHHHIHHHYPDTKCHTSYLSKKDFTIEVSSVLPDAPHYHVFRGGDIMFCTMFSPIYRELGLPEFPSMGNMERYARIVLEQIDAGIYCDISRKRPEYFRRYMPKRKGNWDERDAYDWTPLKFPFSSPPLFGYYQPALPPEHARYNITNYVPPLLDDSSDKENIYEYPCMHAHAAVAHKSATSTTASPRAALFSHLDRSGVK